ncbi:ABC transporter ATP-binding protein [Puniceibacterium sp. IMCC21224]|uniref:ABC transporter ATP-binding protein n=1 Tax=Puniceibacterium sp. IMCC21224 TaxID=1618204 RepID=UPI00064D9488|nr:ABC transporter ATP-binding protein [Puniceibacterium sp. IMCC21224]KMK66227.1 ABC-type antimicrobial peptide transport system, ATPase component [Puniceibacterium sp. IMCC21224]
MLLTASDLTRSYPTSEGPLQVLRGVSLSLDRGQSVALTGESGSGKSTLLHLLGCLDAPDGGALLMDGTPLHGLTEAGRAAVRRQRMGMVFQQLNLIPSLTVGQNLTFQARLCGRLDSTWQDELTGRLGLATLLARYPEQLSGGQQQRVAIGRAIAHRPDLVLADEPTGNLDEETADTVLTLLLDLVQRSGAGLLMVTHSPRLAAKLDRALHLRDGRLA